MALKVWLARYWLTSAWTFASVTFVGGVEVSNQSAVPEPRFAGWMPEYSVMVLYSGVVPWLELGGLDCLERRDQL